MIVGQFAIKIDAGSREAAIGVTRRAAGELQIENASILAEWKDV